MFTAALFLAACTRPDSAVVTDAPEAVTDTPEVVTDPPTSPTDPSAPTWHRDIAPLVADRCGACHRDDGIGTFSIERYADAAAWGPAMDDAVQHNRMPPYFATEDACDMRIDLADDLRLSDAEKVLLHDWVEADMPEGDPTTAADAPLRPIRDLASVQAELALQEPYRLEGTEDVYQCFRLPLPDDLDGDVWLTGAQVVPDNEAIVHHVLVWSDPNDNSAALAGSDGAYRCSGFPEIFPTELIAAWTPGAQPTRTPEGTGTPLKAGGSIVLNIHYHPTTPGTEIDRTQLRLQWTDEKPDNYATWYLVDIPFGASVEDGPNDQGRAEFRIPAGEPRHVENLSFWVPPVILPDMPVFAIAPHMHFLGTDMRVFIDHGDHDTDECLIHTPGFRFDFQQGYVYDATSAPLPVLHAGDTLRVQCQYDNSMANPFMDLHLDASGTSAPRDVYWGEETGDEMCMAMVGLILPPTDWLDLFSWL